MDYPREPSIALENFQDTPLGRNFASLEKTHPEKSGYYLLSDGVDAFVARLILMDAADQAIDVQYYIYRYDIAGKLFTRKLFEAADRGVRIRLLLDDMEIDENDFRFATLALHPNIQVRFFNPFAGRNGIGRLWSMLTAFERVNQRMHNKILAVDNQIAVVGGRNIADEYFSVQPNQYFSDIDLLAVGPIVRDASASFDKFWNSELSVPVNALVGKQPTEQDLKALVAELGDQWVQHEAHEYRKRLEDSDFKMKIKNHELGLIWAPGKVVYDKPEQITHDDQEDHLTLFGAYLKPQVKNTDREFLLISPYLIPGDPGMALFRSLRQKGVKISILTNSLAATDVAVVYGAYADYRKPLLELGINLFELKPNADINDNDAGSTYSSTSSVGAILHAKTLVFDRADVFVGSMNLDPRSVYLNTELALVVTSPKLAEQVCDLFDRMTSLESSLQLTLENDKLVWTTLEDGREVHYLRSPYVSLWKIFWTNLTELLVPNSLL